MEKIFQEIGLMMKTKNFSTFKMVGYRCVDFIIELNYRDCNEYYIAKYTTNNLDEYELIRIGFSKDFSHDEYMKQIDIFSKIYENLDGKTKPENIDKK